MKTWRIPVCYEMCGIVTVEANTLGDAMEQALTDDSIGLPDDASYIDGSWQLSLENPDAIRECYNAGQQDEEPADSEVDLLQAENFIEYLNKVKDFYYMLLFIYYGGINNICHGIIPESDLAIAQNGLREFNEIPIKGSFEDLFLAVDSLYDGVTSKINTIFLSILNYDIKNDCKFYNEAGFGEFWNEVKLPLQLEALWEKYQKEILKPQEPDLILGEPEDGNVAISYYDISDEILVFRDNIAARAFSERHPVDPSEFMEFSNNAWYCL